jgi:D-glycero-alpha-D-manno-heptose-7-phosphate kinase
MIIARSPMRISLGGGGTDLASYYEKFGGFVLSAAIDKYIYVAVNHSWSDEYILKYSQTERAKTLGDIRHPIFKAALQEMKIGANIELVSISDIPAGTGLGSSGSFTTALLKALHAYKRHLGLSPQELAEQACRIEIELLKEPIGKQDQYIAAYGGITQFEIGRSGHVLATPSKISQHMRHTLEDNMAMFFTGYSRSASALLSDQDKRSKTSDASMLENLHFTKDLGFRIKKALEDDDGYGFGELMHEHWESKKKRSGNMSNGHVDELYELARKNGAVGGKLVGAGGGGFLLLYSENKQKVRKAMTDAGLLELRFRFDFEGTKIIV